MIITPARSRRLGRRRAFWLVVIAASFTALAVGIAGLPETPNHAVAELHHRGSTDAIFDGRTLDGEAFWLTNRSAKTISVSAIELQVEEGGTWKAGRDFSAELSSWHELRPGHGGHIIIRPLPGKPNWNGPWRLRMTVRSQVKGLAALPSWIQVVTDSAWRRHYKSIWAIPPFGDDVRSWGQPEAELISETLSNPDIVRR